MQEMCNNQMYTSWGIFSIQIVLKMHYFVNRIADEIIPMQILHRLQFRRNTAKIIQVKRIAQKPHGSCAINKLTYYAPPKGGIFEM